MSHIRTGVIPPIPITQGIIDSIPISVEAGKDAYQLAKSLGFRGLRVNWNRHIRGLKGEQGDQGSKGLVGDNGYSAYELEFITSKFTGSLEEWLYQHSTNYFVDKTIYLSKSFNSYWDTRNINNNSSDFKTIVLPLVPEGDYDFIVDWGDGQQTQINYWLDNSHVYPIGGVYQIKIYGKINGWCFAQSVDASKLLCIDQWGQLELGNRGGYFKDCHNLDVIAEDELNIKSTYNLSQAFKNCFNLNSLPKVETWNWSRVNTLTECFMNCHKFNQSFNNIDSSQLLYIDRAFYNCYEFNQSLHHWEIENLLSAKDFLVNTSLSTNNYGQTLYSWAEQEVIKPNVEINFKPTLANTIASAAKVYLTNNHNWTVIDGGDI